MKTTFFADISTDLGWLVIKLKFDRKGSTNSFENYCEAVIGR